MSETNKKVPSITYALMAMFFFLASAEVAAVEIPSNDMYLRVIDALDTVRSDHLNPPGESKLIDGCVHGISNELRLKTSTESQVRVIAAQDGETRENLREVLAILQNAYPDTETQTKIRAACLRGVTTNLDRYSEYLDQRQLALARSFTLGKGVDVGVDVFIENGYPYVLDVYPGSPSSKVGIRSGDKLLQIGGQDTNGKSIQEVNLALTGEPGSSVGIKISRKGDSSPKFFEMPRQTINRQSVTRQLIVGHIMYVRISQLTVTTLSEFANVLESMDDRELARGFILDLRHNPGGALPPTVGIMAAFLPANSPVLKMTGRHEMANATFYVRPDYYSKRGEPDPLKNVPSYLKSIPMVVLINHATAGGGEAIAGTLQDYKRAKIVGERSSGRGTVQTVRSLDSSSALKITAAMMLRPQSGPFDQIGIVPDIQVPHLKEYFPIFGSIQDIDIAKAVQLLPQ